MAFHKRSLSLSKTTTPPEIVMESESTSLSDEPLGAQPPLKRVRVATDSDEEEAGPSGASSFSQNSALRMIRAKYRLAREIHLAKKRGMKPTREHWWKAHMSFHPTKAFTVLDSALRKRMEEEAATIVEEAVTDFQEKTSSKMEAWVREVEDDLTDIQHSISINLADADRKKWEALVDQECKEVKKKVAEDLKKQQQAPPRNEFLPTPFRPTRGRGGRGKGRGKRSN
jgi:hypothetical protein